MEGRVECRQPGCDGLHTRGDLFGAGVAAQNAMRVRAPDSTRIVILLDQCEDGRGRIQLGNLVACGFRIRSAIPDDRVGSVNVERLRDLSVAAGLRRNSQRGLIREQRRESGAGERVVANNEYAERGHKEIIAFLKAKMLSANPCPNRKDKCFANLRESRKRGA